MHKVIIRGGSRAGLLTGKLWAHWGRHCTGEEGHACARSTPELLQAFQVCAVHLLSMGSSAHCRAYQAKETADVWGQTAEHGCMLLVQYKV